eukprot:Clim_evm25s164 gene=Clim_evmTU25s164
MGDFGEDIPNWAQWEFLDHTADVQIHAWGKDLPDAYCWAAMGMFGYMTDLDKVDIDPEREWTIEVTGHDANSLLYNFMDELLFHFSTELECPRKLEVVEFIKGDESENANWSLKVRAKGEEFNLEKHTQGTEVKAITYSNMQVHEKPDTCEVYVIVDI